MIRVSFVAKLSLIVTVVSRHQSRFRSWVSLLGANILEERTDQVDRASVLGSSPIIAETGFVLSHVVAIAVADASGLSFLWGVIIGLAFATAGVVVLASAETDPQSRYPNTHHSERIPFAMAGGVLLLALLTGIVLGTIF